MKTISRHSKRFDFFASARYGIGMKRNLVLYFMIVLICLQSVALASDKHQVHQAGESHVDEIIAETHSHNTDNTPQAHDFGVFVAKSSHDHHGQSYDETVASDLDCHHCCHCHGVLHLIHDAHLPLAEGSVRNPVPPYHYALIMAASYPDLPPPIA